MIYLERINCCFIEEERKKGSKVGGGGGGKNHLKMLCPGCSRSKTGSHMNTFTSLLIQEGFSGFHSLPADGRNQCVELLS